MAQRLLTRNVKRIEIGETERRLQAQAQCPACGQWADIDHDQFDGSVSLVCECGWHGYIDGRAAG